MFLDSAVIAGLIWFFARYNAEGGFVRALLMLLGVIISTVLIMVALPESLFILIIPAYLILLAAGLTFICGTQPKQTGKIIGCFLLYRLVLWGIPAMLRSSS